MSSQFNRSRIQIKHVPPSGAPFESAALIELLVELTREIQKLKEAMDRSDSTGSPMSEELKACMSKLDDSLVFGKLEIVDPTGQTHDTGSRYNVSHIEEGTGELFVSESLIPAVKLAGQQIAPATVILSHREV